MRHVTWLFIFCLLTLPIANFEAYAEDDNPCKEDIEKFCLGVNPGGARITDCLKEHEQDLSDACKTKQAILQRKVKGAFQECLDDVEQFCKDVRPVGHRVIRCLKQHEAEVSAECRLKLPK